MEGLTNNPRQWTNDDICRVAEHCRQQGGECELFPKTGTDSPTWARLEADGALTVWWYTAKMETRHTFRPRTAEDTGTE